MTDTLTPEERSLRMSLVRAKNTKPETVVRRLVHALGWRYRLHVRSLPGCPDLVFVGKRKVIFVHGCFWHQHSCAMGNRIPKSHIAFWQAKLSGNKSRDVQNRRRLAAMGWKTLVIWECQTSSRSLDRLSRKLAAFLRHEPFPKRHLGRNP